MNLNMNLYIEYQSEQGRPRTHPYTPTCLHVPLTQDVKECINAHIFFLCPRG